MSTNIWKWNWNAICSVGAAVSVGLVAVVVTSAANREPTAGSRVVNPPVNIAASGLQSVDSKANTIAASGQRSLVSRAGARVSAQNDSSPDLPELPESGTYGRPVDVSEIDSPTGDESGDVQPAVTDEAEAVAPESADSFAENSSGAGEYEQAAESGVQGQDAGLASDDLVSGQASDGSD